VTSRQFTDAEYGVEPLQDLHNVIRHPGKFAELKGVPKVARQNCEQIFEALEVNLPFGRKLKENWTKFSMQTRGAREQILHSILGIFQFLIVSKEAAALHSKNKIRRCHITPRIECFGSRQTVKAVIQFDGVEVPGVVVDHFTGGQFPRVERTLPMLVVKPGSADANVARHARCRFDAIAGRKGYCAHSSITIDIASYEHNSGGENRDGHNCAEKGGEKECEESSGRGSQEAHDCAFAQVGAHSARKTGSVSGSTQEALIFARPIRWL